MKEDQIKQILLLLIKNKLIEIGYLTNDSSMKISTNIYHNSKAIEDSYVISFTINDDYIIRVKAKVDHSNNIQCGLQIMSVDEPEPRHYHFSDDTFVIY